MKILKFSTLIEDGHVIFFLENIYSCAGAGTGIIFVTGTTIVISPLFIRYLHV
ncbi:unnamed protein product [Brassica napus]|uniref:(rape) hypothetical protein n=1 Tax=Brassica napus TaxID=3708 RepID=A0A816KIY8_BRANA|nr:unnamed protein product [Brassica napus]